MEHNECACKTVNPAHARIIKPNHCRTLVFPVSATLDADSTSWDPGFNLVGPRLPELVVRASGNDFSFSPLHGLFQQSTIRPAPLPEL